MAMNRRIFLKSLVAVPALVRSFARPAWEVALSQPMPGLFANSGQIAAMYREGAIGRVEGFDWFQHHYIAPAVKHILDQQYEGISQIYRSENWCGTFDLDNQRTD